MRIHLLTILATAGILSSCAMFDMAGDLGESGVAVGGTVIDKENNPIAGIEITMTSYATSDKTTVKGTASCISARDGSYSVVILENDPGDFFRIDAKDPNGVYRNGGIDYISWDGKVNFLKDQNIILSK